MDKEEMELAEELLDQEGADLGFARGLSFGLFSNDKVFPFPRVEGALQEEEEAFCQTVEEFAAREIHPASIDREARIPNELVRKLGELGILGLTIPTEYGGQGASQRLYCRVEEILARHCASTALFVNAHQSIGLKALLLFGTEEQRRKWLPPLARGEKLAAFSLTEEEAGSDAGGVQTRAVYDAERKLFRLNGRKQWTTNGSIADVLTVMARTEIETAEGTKDKISAFLVTPDMPGFKVLNERLEKVGMRGTATANLAFENLEVPEENILGPMGQGLKVALTCLDYGRTTFGATCTGGAKECLRLAIEHARRRKQFGKPLASFPMIKRKIALIASYTYAVEATTYLTAGLIDTGQEDVMIETALLKVFASEALWSIIYETMQIFGGRSFFTDQPLERMMRDARLNQIGEGANEVMRVFSALVGMREVGLQLKEVATTFRKPLSSLGKQWKFAQHQLRRLRPPAIAIHSPHLQSEAEELAKGVRRFGWAVQGVLARYREAVVDQQLQLDRMAEALLCLYTTTAVLGKLDRDLSTGSPGVQDDLAVGKLYCHEAFKRMECAFRGLKDNHDERIEQVSDQLTRWTTLQ